MCYYARIRAPRRRAMVWTVYVSVLAKHCYNSGLINQPASLQQSQKSKNEDWLPSDPVIVANARSSAPTAEHHRAPQVCD
eukprot:364183-Chlamydomonas_euryale.AAC.3